MTPSDIIRNISLVEDEIYRHLQNNCGINIGYISPKQSIVGIENITFIEQMEHLLWMCEVIKGWCGWDSSNDLLEKANKWLGFVQGALWSRKIIDLGSFSEIYDKIDTIPAPPPSGKGE